MGIITDLYEIPIPYSIATRGKRILSYKLHLVWYALLHISIWPVYSNDISLLLSEMGEPVHSNAVGPLMSDLVSMGYFTRVKVQNIYQYKPTNKFNDAKRKYLKQMQEKDTQ